MGRCLALLVAAIDKPEQFMIAMRPPEMLETRKGLGFWASGLKVWASDHA